MNEQAFGRLQVQYCEDFDEAQTKAGHEAVNTAGTAMPVVIFKQGNRYNLSGALPFSFVRTRLDVKSASKKASISDTTDTMNRPEDPSHSEAIARYVTDNRKKGYILPPLTLNIQEPARLYTGKTQSVLKTGFLVVPPTAKLAITDGQHRRKGIIKALDNLSDADAQELASDGVGVMITCETDVDQIHQDFADCSKTKPLPPSQLAVYDRRNPANRLVVDLERRCKIFHGRIDATSKTLGKKSTSLFLANQIRQMVKVLLTGNWHMADQEFEKRAQKELSSQEIYDQELNKFVQYVDYLTEVIPVWKRVAALVPGVQQLSQIPGLRAEGYISLSVTGLLIMGQVGNELFAKPESNWQLYAERLGSKVDWQKNAPIWQGNIVQGPRIITQQRLLRVAIAAVRNAIGWDSPSLRRAAEEVGANLEGEPGAAQHLALA
jgi:DGQHR domain-containing protein